MGSFVDGLLAAGHAVTVVCEQPNHPAGVFQPGYGRRPVVSERAGRCTVRRMWVATSPRKTTAVRLAFYATFSAGAAAGVLATLGVDVALITSPPLPGALAAARMAKLRRVPYVLDVRDIWPAAAVALGELSNERALAVLRRAERWLYRAASRVTATTRPFCRHIDELAGRPLSVHLPNGAVDALIEEPVTPAPSSSPFTVGYAGNMGIAQGFNIVLDAAEELRGEDVRFELVGEGPLKESLRGQASARGLDNVAFRPGVPTSDIAKVLDASHALLVPLRAHEVLDDFIPSKLFDAMARGRPVIVAARGEAAAVVAAHSCGITVPPEDGLALAATVRRLRDEPGLAVQLGAAGRAAAPQYARSHQIRTLEQVLTVAAGAA